MSLTIAPRIPLSSEKLRAVAAGTDFSLPRTAGFTLLRLSDLADKVLILSRVLLSENEAPSVRRAAAHNLYILDDPASRATLLSAARSIRDPVAMVGVVKGLGRIGDQDALEWIEKAGLDAPEPLASQAKFAATLLSHRLGLPGHDIEAPRQLMDLPRGEGEEVRIEKPAAEEARLCLDSIAVEPFGISLAKGSLQQLDCERNRWMLALNKEFTGAEGKELLRQRKGLLGVIASKNDENSSYSIIFLMLTAPAERGRLRLFLTRTTGDVGFSGEVAISRRGPARFELSSAARPGIFALKAEGSFDEEGNLDIARAVSALTIKQKRHPRPARIRPGG